MKPARILFLNPTAQLGGAEYSLLDLAASLDRQRFVARLACPDDGPLGAAATSREISVRTFALDDRFAALSLKGTRSGVLGLGAAALASAPLALRIREMAADAAIVHTNGNKAHLLSAVMPRRSRVVWHVRDFWKDGRAERALVSLACARASAVIANSQAVRDHLESMGIPSAILHAVPNGIDVVRFSPHGPRAALRRQFGWPRDAPLIGIAGMLARWKGQDVVLRAFARVLERRPDARCVVVGDEIYVTRGQTGFAAELRQLASELGISHAVGFTGYRNDVPDVYRALDILVHASVEPEPFGRVVAEGMAAGRAVIATDAGGVPEVVGSHESAARLVPCGDAGALAAAIADLLAHPQRAAAMGAAARERIVRMFPVASHVDRVQAIYDQALERRAHDLPVARTATGSL